MLCSRDDSVLEGEVAAAVPIHQPGLRARSHYSFGIKCQPAHARQHKWRLTLRREREYMCRQHLIGIFLYSNRPGVQAEHLDVVRVAVVQLDATASIEEKTIAVRK